MRGVLGISVCAIIAGGASAQSIDTRLVGRWYGVLDAPGEGHCWVSERKVDGTYRTDFITQDGRLFNSYYQQGTWTASGETFSTVVQSENGTTVPPHRTQYTIVRVRPQVLVYRHDDSGTQFTVNRVGAGFRLPAKCGKTDA